MRVIPRLTPTFFLRVGLGAAYLYSGRDLLTHPTGWLWAIRPLPATILGLIQRFGVEHYLRVQGGVEFAAGLVLLAWFLPRWLVRLVAILAAAQFAAILLLVGVSLDTFRDIGLLGAAVALVLSLR